ncbi:elongation factor P, partial [Dysosmobacter welbionis]
VLQQLAGVAGLPHDGRQDAELHRGHVGNQDLMGLFHFRGELGVILEFQLHVSRLLSGSFPGLVLLIQGSEQAPQPDADSAQVGDLVDLQLGVQLAARLQDLPCLVGGDGVHAAAEGDQLHQVHIPLGAAVAGCRVETGVVGPLVQHRGGEFLHPVGDGVLRDDRGAGAGNQSVDAVVDLRVHVIGPACQH